MGEAERAVAERLRRESKLAEQRAAAAERERVQRREDLLRKICRETAEALEALAANGYPGGMLKQTKIGRGWRGDKYADIAAWVVCEYETDFRGDPVRHEMYLLSDGTITASSNHLQYSTVENLPDFMLERVVNGLRVLKRSVD